MRPAAMFQWTAKEGEPLSDTGEYIGDIALVFTMHMPCLGKPISSVYCLVQWHRAVKLKTRLPCRCTVLEERYSIVQWEDIIRKLVVVPQLGPVSDTCVVPVRERVITVRSDGTKIVSTYTRVLAFSNNTVLYVG